MLQPIRKFLVVTKIQLSSNIPYRIVRNTPVFYNVWKCEERNV